MELWVPPGYCDFPTVEYYDDEESWGIEPDEEEDRFRVSYHGKYKVVVKY